MTRKICVIGLGYIGLPSSVVFAENDWEVIGVDTNASVVNSLSKGIAHIKEAGLNELLLETVNEKKFVAKTSPVKADVFIIAVPTPMTSDLSADLSYVESAVRSILPCLLYTSDAADEG